MPPKSYIDRQITGTVTFLESGIEAAERKASIRAEPDNPESVKLLPGDTVTLVIPMPDGRRD
jgi:multidrug efflux pump subunit AcrA (membrane-fusion protein)